MAAQQETPPPITPEEWDAYEAAGQRWGVDPYLLPALRHGEGTLGKTDTVTDAGTAGKARGPFQFIDDTAKRYDLKDPHDLHESADRAAQLLRDNFERYKGDPDMAVLSYTGGNDVGNWGPKTQNYHRTVADAYQQYTGRPLTDGGFAEKVPAEQPAQDTPEAKPAVTWDALEKRITALREKGIDDNTIADFMRTSKTFGPTIEESRKNGWDYQDIFKHYGLAYQPRGAIANTGVAALQAAPGLVGEAAMGAAEMSDSRSALTPYFEQYAAADTPEAIYKFQQTIAGSKLPLANKERLLGFAAQRLNGAAPVDLATFAGQKPEDMGLYKAGKAAKEWADKTFPMNPEEKERFSGQLGSILGGTVAALPLAIAGPAGMAAAAGMFGFSGAHTESEAAKSAGATEEQRARAAMQGFAVNAIAGSVDLGAVLKPVTQVAPGFAAWAATRLTKAARDGIIFPTVGEAQQWLSSQIQKEYDPNAHYDFDWTRVGAQLAAGAGLGAAMPAHRDIREPALRVEPPAKAPGTPPEQTAPVAGAKPGKPSPEPSPESAPVGAPGEQVIPSEREEKTGYAVSLGADAHYYVVDAEGNPTGERFETERDARARADELEIEHEQVPPEEQPAAPPPEAAAKAPQRRDYPSYSAYAAARAKWRAEKAAAEKPAEPAPETAPLGPEPAIWDEKTGDIINGEPPAPAEGQPRAPKTDDEKLAAEWAQKAGELSGETRREPETPPDQTAVQGDVQGPLAPPEKQPRQKGRLLDLVQFLSAHGGIRDDGGNLKAMNAPWWLAKKNGMTLDRARELAQEAGYLPAEDPNRPPEVGTNELLDQIGQNLAGNKVWRQADLDEVQRRDGQRQAVTEGRKRLDELGIPHDQMKDEHVPTAAAIAEMTNEAVLDHIEKAHDDAMAAHRAGDEDLKAIQSADHGEAGDIPLDHLGTLGPEAGRGFEQSPPEAGNPRLGETGAGGHPEGTGVPPRDLGELGTEKTGQGEQTLIPGVAPITDRARVESGMQKPLAGKGQKPADEGLFDTGSHKQGDLLASRRGIGGIGPLRAAIRSGDVKRGAAAIIERLRMAANLDEARRDPQTSGLDRADAREIEDFITFIGHQMFDGIGLRILRGGPQGVLGSFNAYNRIVTIFRSAIESGELTHTAVHELWHTLERALPSQDRVAVTREFQRQQAKYLRANEWARPFLERAELRDSLRGQEARDWLARRWDEDAGNHVEITDRDGPSPTVQIRWDHDNYRFKNRAEYFAETMADKYFDHRDMDDAKARSVVAHARDMWQRMVAGAKRLFGRDQTGRIYEGFTRGAYEPAPSHALGLQLGTEYSKRGAGHEDGPTNYASTEPTAEGPRANGLPEFRKFSKLGAFAHRAAGDWVIQKGKAGHEWLVAIDQKTGAATQAYTYKISNMVGFSPGLAKLVNDPNNRVVVHHNHPGGGALSPGDIGLLVMPGLEWVVAHAPDGEMSAARLRPEAAAEIRSLPAEIQYPWLKNAAVAAQKAASEHVQKLFDDGWFDRHDQDDQLAASLALLSVSNAALDAVGLTHHIGTRDPARFITAEAAQQAYEAAFAAVRPHAEELGLNPKEEAGDVGIHRPAGDVLSERGLAEAFGKPQEAAAERPAGAAGDRGRARDAGAAGDGVEAPRQDRLPGFEESKPGFGQEPLKDAVERLHQDAVSDMISAAAEGGGRDLSTEQRALRAIAMRGTQMVKNLNIAEKVGITPATLARLDSMSARLWNSWKRKDLQTHTNIERLRSTIADSLAKLPAPSRDRVYGALELARLYDWRPKDNGQPVRVTNTSAWRARKTRPGETYVLTAPETRALHDAIKLGDEGRRLHMEALARREGWNGPADADEIAKAARGLAAQRPLDKKAIEWHGPIEPAEMTNAAKRLGRLASVLYMAEKDMHRPYFPAMRFGDYYIAVKPKAGVDKESLGGHPRVQWFETVERPMLDELIGRVRKNSTDVRAVNDRIAEIRKIKDHKGDIAFPEDKFDIETGDIRHRPEILRSVNIPAIEKLFMMMERNVTKELMAKAMRRADIEGDRPGAASMSAGQGRARDAELRKGAKEEYERLHGSVADTFLSALYDDLMAGYKRQAHLDVGGWSPDFDRAVGTHTFQIARNSSEMIHRRSIDEAYESLQTFHPEPSVRDYWKNWRGYMEKPESIGSRFANTLSGYGFAYALGMNPASTFIFAAHTPMAAAPIMSVGVGMPRAAAALVAALGRSYARARIDLQQGPHISTKNMGDTPEKRAYFKKLDEEGLLHSMGSDDVGSINDRASEPWGAMRPVMRKAFDLATSNIRIIDQANRIGIADAAYELAKNPATLRKMAAPLLKHDAMFQDMVREYGLTPESFGRFMLQKAGFEWGKAARAPMQRGAGGTLLFTLHGFQTRYLSAAWHLMNRMGPEGKIAAAWMLGSLAAGAGAYALPFTQDLETAADKILHTLTGRDPMIGAKVQSLLSDAFGKVGAEIILHGALTELMGTDMTARIGFGDVIGREADPSNVLGTVPAILASRLMAAGRRLSSGQGALAAGAELLPSGLRNPTMAAVQRSQGVLSQHGTTEIPKDKVTAHDVATRALGFQPLSQTRGFERQDYDYRLQHKDDLARRDLLHEAALLSALASEAEKANDTQGAAALGAQLRKMLSDHPDLKITPQALQNARRQMSDPETARIMRLRAAVRGQALTQNPYPAP